MSRMNESCHIWMSHVTYEWVASHMNQSRPTEKMWNFRSTAIVQSKQISRGKCQRMCFWPQNLFSHIAQRVDFWEDVPLCKTRWDRKCWAGTRWSQGMLCADGWSACRTVTMNLWRWYGECVGCRFCIRGVEKVRCGYGVATVSGIDKLEVSFAKEPYERDDILQKRPMLVSILLTLAAP